MPMLRRRSKRINRIDVDEEDVKQEKSITPIKEKVTEDEKPENDELGPLVLEAMDASDEDVDKGSDNDDADRETKDKIVDEEEKEAGKSDEDLEDDDGDDEETEEQNESGKSDEDVEDKVRLEIDLDEEEDDERVDEEENESGKSDEDAEDEGRLEVDIDEEDESKNDSTRSTKRKNDAQDDVAVKRQKIEPQGLLSTDIRYGVLLTLLVRNLPVGTTEEAFKSLFNERGIRCRSFRTNFPRCKAFIDINSSDEKKALELDQMEWNGKTISVMKSPPKSISDENGSSKTKSKESVAEATEKTRLGPSKTLLVKNLPYDVTYHNLKAKFLNVVFVRMLKSKYGGKPRGMAYVEFENEASATKVIEKVDGHEIKGRKLSFEYAECRTQRNEHQTDDRSSGRHGESINEKNAGKSGHSKTLYLKGETSTVSEEELREYFKDASYLHMHTYAGKLNFFAGVKVDSVKGRRKHFPRGDSVKRPKKHLSRDDSAKSPQKHFTIDVKGQTNRRGVTDVKYQMKHRGPVVGRSDDK